MSEQVSIDEEVERLLGKQEEVTAEVELPSKSKFYKGKGKLKVRGMTFADEKATIYKQAPNFDPINEIIRRCVKNVNFEEILSIDKVPILLAIRALTYGNEYKSTLTCQSCSHINDINVDMNKLEINYLSDDYKDGKLEVELPKSKLKILIRLPKIVDISFGSNIDSFADNLWRFVEKINNNDNPTVISKVVENLSIKDMHVLLKAFAGNGAGKDTRVYFKCANCKATDIFNIPFDDSFFTDAS